MTLEVGQLIAQYRLDQVIARGRATVVYLARDLNLDKLVVVKVLKDDFRGDQEYRQRFIGEAKTAAKLDDHPNIVSILNWGERDGQPYIVTQYVAGLTLAELMSNQPGHATLPVAESLILLEQVGSALDFAHKRSFVHRDVKPGNIMVTVNETPPTGYLVDFGITKSIAADSASSTAYGVFMGTANYSAPEQISSAPDIDGRADVYSLACTAFEMLTGQVPFASAVDDAARIVAHLQWPVPSARALRPTLPAEVDAVLARGMAKDKTDRYRTCGEFVSDLRASFPASELEYVRPVAATAVPPPPNLLPPPKRSTRAKVLIWLAAALVVAALAVGAVFFFVDNTPTGVVGATTTTLAPTTTTAAPTTTVAPTTTLAPTTTTAAPTTTTAPPPPPETTPPPPPVNQYGDVIGQPLADNATPERALVSGLQSRADPSTIATPGSPMFYYAEWLRLTAGSPGEAVTATADGYAITADSPATLTGFEAGADGKVANASECRDSCVRIGDLVAIDQACTPGTVGCAVFRSASAQTTAFQRATINLRIPKISLLFELVGGKPVTSVVDATGSVDFDRQANYFSIDFERTPQPGTISLLTINYTDGSTDTVTVTYS